ATQIVSHLEPSYRRKLNRRRMSIASSSPLDHEREELPITANPAMQAFLIRQVCGGMSIDQLDIGQQARAQDTALQKIMAQDAVVRDSFTQQFGECVNINNPLADEHPVSDTVLIRVRCSEYIGIIARRTA